MGQKISRCSRYWFSCVLGLIAPSVFSVSSASADLVSAAPYTVEVTLVGAVANDSDLGSVIEDLLRARGSQHIQKHQSALLESDLLDSTSRQGRGLIRIWITLPSSMVVRIWFAAPSLDRYLWRDVPLSHGLDAVAREQIAQIVQSSSDALNRGSEGMSRADARREWQQHQASNQTDEQPVQSVPVQSSESNTPTRRQSQSTAWLRREHFALTSRSAQGRWRPLVGAGYALAVPSHALGILHGPILEVGLNYEQKLHALGLRLAYERHFSQSFSREPAKFDLTSQAAWALLVWRYLMASTVGLASGVGFGIEFTDVKPSATGSATFEANPSYTDRAYLVRLRTGVQGTIGPLGWLASAGADISLSNTSYGTVTESGRYDPLLELWSVRPGLQLGFVYE